MSEEDSEPMDSGTESGDSEDESDPDSPGTSRKQRDVLQFDTLTSEIQQNHLLISGQKDFILDVVKKMLMLPGTPLLVMTASKIIRWLFFLWACFCYRQQPQLPVPILFISPLVALIAKMGTLLPKSLRVCCLYEGAQILTIMTRVTSGSVDVLLLTPEMLEKILQRDRPPRISFACIDNAECVVEFQVYRHIYLRLNKLLRGLGVKYLLGLSTLATESTKTLVMEQFGFKDSHRECHSPVISRNIQLSSRVCASCSNKDEKLIELLNKQHPLSTCIVICGSGDEIEHVSQMLRQHFKSSSTHRESAVVTHTKTNKKRIRSGGHQESIKRCKPKVVQRYDRTMTLGDKTRVSDSFEKNEIDILVTTPALCMGLPTAEVIVYYTMPRTYESLMKGIYQVSERQHQGYIHVLLDEQCLKDFRRSTMNIPTKRTIEKQVKEIFEGEFTKAEGITDEYLGFILASLESDGHLELASPISECRHLKEDHHHPNPRQLKQICTTLRERLEKQAKLRVTVYKELYTDLSSSTSGLENRISRMFVSHEPSRFDELEQVNTKPAGKQKSTTTVTATFQGSTRSLQQQPSQDGTCTAAESQMDGCSQGSTNDMLGEDDLVDIMGYLHTLDKSQLSNLGLVLGLSLHHVKGLMDSKTFLGDMVLSWLNQADNVTTRSGVPTWKSLVKALRHKLLRQNGIASQIAKDKNLVAM